MRHCHGPRAGKVALVADDAYPPSRPCELIVLDRAFVQQLPASGLDGRRLALYGLAMHLSLIPGPLAMADGDYPQRDEMIEIAEYNIERALAFAPEPGRP